MVWFAGIETPPFFHVIVAALAFGLENDMLPSCDGAMKCFE